MLKLAVNFSESLLNLLQQNPGIPVDYIKVPTIPFPDCFSQFEQGEKWRKLLPHPAQPGVIALGHPQPQQQFNPELVGEIIRRTNPSYLSTHLEAQVAYFPEFRQLQHINHPELKQVMLKRFLTAIKKVKATTGLPLILENFPYYLWLNHFRTAAEPQFIAELCTAGDCGLLLDIAHARCSAASLGWDDQDYIFALPLERLREVHLAGVGKCEYGICDTHTALEDWDYQLLQAVLERAKPEIITLEYGGMPEQIRDLNGKLRPVSRNCQSELETMIFRLRELIEGVL
ncbi:MAG TPA: DUF692 family multinuclear iron-containing protein [Bacillota bacterium]